MLYQKHCKPVVIVIGDFCFTAIKSIQTASYCGGINTIIRNVLDSQVWLCCLSTDAHLVNVLRDSES